MNKKNAFARELLNMRLCDICGSGETFRDACSSWATKSTAEGASFYRICTRRILLVHFVTTLSRFS